MNEQKKLPRPTPGLTFKVRIDNIAIFLRTGEYEDGTLGEIFIDMYKEGAGYKSILANFAITVSWLLQYGVPLEKLVDKFQYTRFEPAGIVIGDDDIKMCSSIIDWIFRRLGITYLNMELGNVKKFGESVVDGETFTDAPAADDVVWGQSLDLKSSVEKGEDVKVDGVRGDIPPGNVPAIQVYTFGSGSVGLRPVGYMCSFFLDYCRRNKERRTVDGEFFLDFNDDSIVIFSPPSGREKVTNALKHLWFSFYGKQLDLGDL